VRGGRAASPARVAADRANACASDRDPKGGDPRGQYRGRRWDRAWLRATEVAATKERSPPARTAGLPLAREARFRADASAASPLPCGAGEGPGEGAPCLRTSARGCGPTPAQAIVTRRAETRRQYRGRRWDVTAGESHGPGADPRSSRAFRPGCRCARRRSTPSCGAGRAATAAAAGCGSSPTARRSSPASATARRWARRSRC
jgi:hypothetical protein